MSTWDERTLEFNIVSASDLKKVMKFGPQRCFVVAYVNPSQKKSTKVDRTGGRNPLWNSKFNLTCDEGLFSKVGSYITVEIYSQGRITNKSVGTVTIPLNEVSRDGRSGASKAQVLSHPVRRRSGRIQGVLNLSVKLGEKRTISTLPAPRCYGKQEEDEYTQSYRAAYGYQSPQRYGAPQRITYGGLPQYSYAGQKQWRSSP